MWVLMGVRDWDLRLQQDLDVKQKLVEQGMPLWQALLVFVGKPQISKCECVGNRHGKIFKQ